MHAGSSEASPGDCPACCPAPSCCESNQLHACLPSAAACRLCDQTSGSPAVHQASRVPALLTRPATPSRPGTMLPPGKQLPKRLNVGLSLTVEASPVLWPCSRCGPNAALFAALVLLHAVYVGNYEYDASERELERTFEKYGEVERVEYKSGACGICLLPVRPQGRCYCRQGAACLRWACLTAVTT